MATTTMARIELDIRLADLLCQAPQVKLAAMQAGMAKKWDEAKKLAGEYAVIMAEVKSLQAQLAR
jgi:hypothetical protein